MQKEEGKLFIGGLSWDTDQEMLREYFSQYGEVSDAVVMRNTETNKSRGFGFITFRDPSVAEVCLQTKHVIDNRQVDAKACNTKGNRGAGGESRGRGGGGGGGGGKSMKPEGGARTNKIFMGGIPVSATEESLKAVFAPFGSVTEVVIMMDKEAGRPRGFGFLTFESEESVEQVCDQHYVHLDGKKIECKRAEPRGRSGPGAGRGNDSGGRGNMNFGNGGGGGFPPQGGQNWQGNDGFYQGGYGQNNGFNPQQGPGGYNQGYGQQPGYNQWNPQGGQDAWGSYQAQPGQGGPGYGGGYGGQQAPGMPDPYGNQPAAQQGMGQYTQDNSGYGPKRSYGQNPGGQGGMYGQGGGAQYGAPPSQGGFGDQSGGYGASSNPAGGTPDASQAAGYGGAAGYAATAGGNQRPGQGGGGGGGGGGSGGGQPFHPYRR